MSKKGKDIFAALPDFDAPNFDDNIDQAEIIDIDTDDLDKQAQEVAKAMVSNFSKLYYDDDFMESQPNLKKRIDVELESLRLLIKMRKGDEITHDLLLRSIGRQSTNERLYKCLATIQKSMMDIQTKMDETLKRLNDMLKNVQLEMNFTPKNEEEKKQETDDTSVCRGSKEYIEKLKNRMNDTIS